MSKPKIKLLKEYVTHYDEDGSVIGRELSAIETYNEQGKMIETVGYGPGEVPMSRNVIAYDNDGDVVLEEDYENGELVQRMSYEGKTPRGFAKTVVTGLDGAEAVETNTWNEETQEMIRVVEEGGLTFRSVLRFDNKNRLIEETHYSEDEEIERHQKISYWNDTELMMTSREENNIEGWVENREMTYDDNDRMIAGRFTTDEGELLGELEARHEGDIPVYRKYQSYFHRLTEEYIQKAENGNIVYEERVLNGIIQYRKSSKFNEHGHCVEMKWDNYNDMTDSFIPQLNEFEIEYWD